MPNKTLSQVELDEMRPLRYPLNSHLRIYAKLVYVFLKNYTTFLNSCITMVDRIEFGLPPSLALSLSVSYSVARFFTGNS